MKALYISYDGMTDPLGQSQVIPYLIGLTKKGYNFTILSYEKHHRYIQFGETIRKQLRDNSIDWKPFRYHKRFSVAATSYDIFSGFLYLLFFIPVQRIRILHCRSYISSILGLLFRRIYGTKFIFDMRGFWADERLEGGIFKGKYLYHLFKYLEKQFIKNADAVIALTANSIDEMRTWPYISKKYNSKFYHITTCCDIKKFSQTYTLRTHKKNDIHSLNFVYVGSVGPWHSLPELTGFISLAYNYLPKSSFKILCNSSEEQFFRFIKSNKLNIDRFVISSVLHNEIANHLTGTDIGFFFIPPVYSKIASSPTKLGEMLSSGIPVITGHSIGDTDRLITDNQIGYVVRDFNETEYKKAIDYVINLILKDGDKLSERCLKAANDYFSLEKGIERYNEIYTKLINV